MHMSSSGGGHGWACTVRRAGAAWLAMVISSSTGGHDWVCTFLRVEAGTVEHVQFVESNTPWAQHPANFE